MEATIVNPLPSWKRQLGLLVEEGRITLGMGVSMATHFPTSVWEEVREVGGGGCGGDNGLIQVEMSILPHLGKKS